LQRHLIPTFPRHGVFADGFGMKIGAEHVGGSEKQGFGAEKSLDEPSDGKIIAKETSKLNFTP